MITSTQLRKENIAEYILYMWQIEDIIRAHDFDINKIEQNIISAYNVSEELKNQIRDWYANLILMMHEQGIREKGHLSFIKGIMDDLYDLHRYLIKKGEDREYLVYYNRAKENIDELRRRSGGKNMNDVEICLTGLYGLLLLRLQKKEVAKETEEAMKTFSNLMALLADRFKKMEKGEIKLDL